MVPVARSKRNDGDVFQQLALGKVEKSVTKQAANIKKRLQAESNTDIAHPKASIAHFSNKFQRTGSCTYPNG